MSPRRLTLLIGLVLAAIAAGILFVLPRVEEALAPEPVAAWVAIEVADSGVAEVGRVALEAGTAFRLHAVLEARIGGDERVFYTDAERLRFPDGEVTADSLRPWQLPWVIRPLWFTVEGEVPYLRLGSEEAIDHFSFQDFLRPEWGRLTSVRGDLSSQFDAQLESRVPRDRDFGTQRYHVWIELYRDETDLIPEHRVKSPGAGEVQALGALFPTVVAALPGAAGPASSVFGLTQLEVDPPSPMLRQRLQALADAGLVFSRETVLRESAAAAQRTVSTLDWQPLELGTGVRWQEQVSRGDLLQAGPRFVVLYRDEGEPGVLDGADLCFDFEAGAAIRKLDDVFVGEGELDWAPVGSP